jgi:histone H3/H4
LKFELNVIIIVFISSFLRTFVHDSRNVYIDKTIADDKTIRDDEKNRDDKTIRENKIIYDEKFIRVSKKISRTKQRKIIHKINKFEFMIIFMIFLFNSIIDAILNKALREIRTLQRVTNLLMSRMLFQRVIKKILQKHELMREKHLQDLRIQRNVLNALQKVCEDFLVKTFESMF